MRIFVNSANKIFLQEYLFEELQNLSLHQKNIVYSIKERCLWFNPLTIWHGYFSHQHEADTKIFYHGKILDSRNDISAVVNDAEDTKVLVISTYASHKLEKDVVPYSRNKLTKCKSLCSVEVASVLIGLHTDAVSGFYGHSKKKVYTKIQKNREGQQMLLNIGKNESISQIDINNARKLVIKFITVTKPVVVWHKQEQKMETHKK